MKNLMHLWPSQVGVNQEDVDSGLCEADGDVGGGRGGAFARLARSDQERAESPAGRRKQYGSTQVTVSLRQRGMHTGIDQQLRSDVPVAITIPVAVAVVRRGSAFEREQAARLERTGHRNRDERGQVQ